MGGKTDPERYMKRRRKGLCGQCGAVRTGALRARCDRCSAILRRISRKSHARPGYRERHAAYMRSYYRRDTMRWYVSTLKKKYGMSASEYHGMLDNQKGGCAICARRDDGTKLKRRLSVDHDHATGEIRGLLCGRCNAVVGFLAEDPKRAHRVVAYLMRWI